MITLLIVFISLSILIFFHEFGHFIFSRLAKIKVEEFGFGYPPRIIGLVKIKKTNKWQIFFGKKLPPSEELISTIYSLNLIPFGGFNKIKGEEGETITPDSFYFKPWWQRIASLTGGVIMNLILAIILYSIGFNVGIPSIAKKNELGPSVHLKEVGIQIISVKRSSPADEAGLLIGDIILAVDGQEYKEEKDIQAYINRKVGQVVNLKIKRGKKEINFNVVPRLAQEVFSEEELAGRELTGGVIGVIFSKVNIISYPFPLAIFEGVKTTFITFWRIIAGVYFILKELLIKGKMVGEVVGVVGIGTFIGEVYQIGFIYLLQFIAFISIAIAVSQLIPFPALDGGRIFFTLIEAIRGKPISRKIEVLIHNIGFTILILLMVFITYRDLMRLGEKLFK
ncbi:MAG: M50 family metallopeptidase [Patescibacteria group bacterium]